MVFPACDQGALVKMKDRHATTGVDETLGAGRADRQTECKAVVYAEGRI